MAKTYNGRFNRPNEPKNPTPWLVSGIISAVALIPSLHAFGVAICVGCFVTYGKRCNEKKMYERFHEFVAIIGMRERIGLKELAKVCNSTKGEVRPMVQQMVARGYFGEDAYLDVNRDELVLPPPPKYAGEQARTGGWRMWYLSC